MKNRNRIFAHFMLAGSLALAVPVEAQPNLVDMPHCCCPMRPVDMPGMPDEAPPPPFLHGLNLGEAQHNKIFDLMHALAPAMRNQAKTIHRSQMELRHLAMSSEYSEEKAKALAETDAQAMARMAQMQARIDNQIYQILTPEQRKLLEKRRAWQDLPPINRAGEHKRHE